MDRLGRRQVLGHDDGTALSCDELLALIRDPGMHPIVRADAAMSLLRLNLVVLENASIRLEVLHASTPPHCEHGRDMFGTCAECADAEDAEYEDSGDGEERLDITADFETFVKRDEERYQREKSLPPIVVPLSSHAFRTGGPKTESYKWRLESEASAEDPLDASEARDAVFQATYKLDQDEDDAHERAKRRRVRE